MMETKEQNRIETASSEDIVQSLKTIPPILVPFKAYDRGASELPMRSEIKRIVDQNDRASAVQVFAKRALDVILASLGIIALSPLLLLIALAVKIDSKGPALFIQTRVGKGGRLFRLLKFRTMVANAEILKQSLLTLNEIDGPAFKMRCDPRVTRLGRFLRKTSLDELPQLWNVVLGNMSLVGPRPALPSEVMHWEKWQFERLSVDQGCTCIWQVSGRNHLSFEEWMSMDLQYVKTWSVLLDVKLIARTFVVMLTGRGAY